VYFLAFPDVQWHVLRTVCEGRLICQEWRATGTHLGDFDGLAPTGQTVTRSGCDVTLIGTNRLIEVETTYWDALGLYEQLGLGVQA
jgi:predicted ester cyclase